MATMQYHHRTGDLTQDGQSAADWLEDMFEFELCAECGGDACDHEVDLDILGLFHATCLHPPLDDDGRA